MNAIFIYVIVLDKMCFYMLNLCWFKHKKIFECLVVFGKYFVLLKTENFKTVLPCFGDSVMGQTSRMPQSWALGSVLATCLRVKGSIIRGTQRFLRLSSWLPCKWDFQSRKTLSKIFQNFLLEVFWRVKLATFWWLTSVTKNVCFA